MYKLKKIIFGWDYIYWKNSAGHGIARVFKTKDNRVVYFRYKITELIDEIYEPKQVYWLTCNPNKYFNQNK